MSLFSKIAGAEHTFAAWVEKELALVQKDAPQIEQVTSAILKYVGPALQLILTFEGNPVAGAEVGKVVSEAQTDLAVASALVYDFGPNPDASSIITSVQQNVAGLEQAGHIKNAKSIDAANKVVNNLAALSTALSQPKV